MSDRPERRRKGGPPIEAGVAKTEQVTEVRSLDGELIESKHEGNGHEEPTPLHALQPAEDGSGEPEVVTVTPEAIVPEQPLYTAKLTGEEVAEVRRRIEATDFLAEEAKTRRAALERQAKDLDHLTRAGAASQRDLTGYVQALIRKYNLAEGMQYRADVEQAALLPVGPIQQG